MSDIKSNQASLIKQLIEIQRRLMELPGYCGGCHTTVEKLFGIKSSMSINHSGTAAACSVECYIRLLERELEYFVDEYEDN